MTKLGERIVNGLKEFRDTLEKAIMSEEVEKMLTEEIEWTGDLNDDCVAKWRGMLAHAEALNDHQWFCSVSVDEEAECLFHSVTDDVHHMTGKSARSFCENFMRLHAIRQWSDEMAKSREALAQMVRENQETGQYGAD